MTNGLKLVDTRRCESFGVVDVLIARQAAIDRLPQQIGKGDLEKTEGYVRLPCPIGLYWSSAP